MIALWKFVDQQLHKGYPVAVLKVLDSTGSSPGRQGFQMAVSQSKDLHGSIGGGIMEHKLVELASDRLRQGISDVLFIEQVHQKDTTGRRSGMICSGEQKIAIYCFYKIDISWKLLLNNRLNLPQGQLIWSASGISCIANDSSSSSSTFHYTYEQQWELIEPFPQRALVHIIGGGHVGLALSKQLHWLGFKVHLYDDRPGLNTLLENTYADAVQIIDYASIGTYLPADPTAYIVIMSFGYRTDKVVLQQLLGKQFKYIGMLGSAAKVAQLWQELRAEGFSKAQLAKVHAPIGLAIYSQTPAEIAVSIAAQLIQVKIRRGLKNRKSRLLGSATHYNKL